MENLIFLRENMYEAAFKNIDNTLLENDVCGTVLNQVKFHEVTDYNWWEDG